MIYLFFYLKLYLISFQAFYFDLALRTFLAIKSILQNGLWPPNMKYLTCDEYDGTNSPDHSIDLRSYFIDVIQNENLY